MRPIFRVARATFHEAWRRRFLNGILIFAILIIGSSWAFAYLQPGAELQMVIDIGLGSIRFFGMLIAVFLGTRLVPDEIELRTIHTILAKPVSRAQFLFGKYLGGVGTLAANMLLMGAAFYVVFAIKAPQFLAEKPEDAMIVAAMYSNIAKAILLTFFEVFLILGIAVVAATLFSWVLSVIFTFVFYFVGHMSDFFQQLSDPERGASKIAQIVMGALYRILPHFEIFDIREAILMGTYTPWSVMFKTIGEGVAYLVVVLLIGYLVFNEREV
ncbi:MAG: ABC transporter permease subunit [candidate division WS1 bacterium]|jgi:ABC-type transport system involved in multi-copper enzyme maturation permease subunit|nr:ABC transporter permease subunit [candidate division WS1 bacterium]